MYSLPPGGITLGRTLEASERESAERAGGPEQQRSSRAERPQRQLSGKGAEQRETEGRGR